MAAAPEPAARAYNFEKRTIVLFHAADAVPKMRAPAVADAAPNRILGSSQARIKLSGAQA
jgi:hypothetical protein